MRSRTWILSAVLLFCSQAAARAATFVVNSVGDEPDDNVADGVCHTVAGACTLRAAIMQANSTAGADVIHFSIPGSGVHTIRPSSTFDPITETVTIDGYSQPGSSPNTLAVGDNAVLTIELDGSLNQGVANGLTIEASGCTVRGLVINRFTNPAIVIGIGPGAGGNTIQGDFIGTDPTGTIARGNAGIGVWIRSPNNTLGGLLPADRNVISATRESSTTAPPDPFATNVQIDGTVSSSSNGNVVEGNYIGTDASGMTALSSSNGAAGLGITTANSGGVTIGGATAAARNVISGNRFFGVDIASGPCTFATTDIVVRGNFIGVNANGAALGNGYGGVHIGCNTSQVTVGGTAAGAGNVIAYNGRGLDGAGVRVDIFGRAGSSSGAAGTRNAIRGNRIFQNTSNGATPDRGLGIDLGGNGPTPNDVGDADSGPNDLQNSPIITSVTYGVSSTTIQGTLNSNPSTTFDVDFYSNPICAPRPRDLLEGETYIGSTQTTTNGSGDATFNVTLPVAVASGSPITATATDPQGNTSEFSQDLILSMFPTYGPASGAVIFSLTGHHFLSGATVNVGGLAATNVTVFGFNSIQARTPALVPGSVNDVTVANTDGTVGILRNGFAADFLDVPAGNLFEKFVGKLIGSGITAGCGGGNYCPANSVTRAQMAVFLLRSRNGLCYAPPPATGTVFADVPAGSFAAAWIEALAASGVTAGCGGGNYCPSSPVTRAQMAVFLLRTLEGSTYAPPPCVTPTFSDVPCSSGFASWIEELVRRGITAGCGGGNYCPDSAVTRGQMAVFLSTTFGLP
jgi:CSLREA domain-containing protein